MRPNKLRWGRPYCKHRPPPVKRWSPTHVGRPRDASLLAPSAERIAARTSGRGGTRQPPDSRRPGRRKCPTAENRCLSSSRDEFCRLLAPLGERFCSEDPAARTIGRFRPDSLCPLRANGRKMTATRTRPGNAPPAAPCRARRAGRRMLAGCPEAGWKCSRIGVGSYVAR
jgi:hypothetical protein